MIKLSIETAEGLGYTVDRAVYPHVGYKGPRFSPTDAVVVYTEAESVLLRAIGEVLVRASMSEALRAELVTAWRFAEEAWR